jgi:hypothetical protein
MNKFIRNYRIPFEIYYIFSARYRRNIINFIFGKKSVYFEYLARKADFDVLTIYIAASLNLRRNFFLDFFSRNLRRNFGWTAVKDIYHNISFLAEFIFERLNI